MSLLKTWGAAILLGAGAACGFAPLDLWPLTLACLAGLMLLLGRTDTVRGATAIGWCFGLGLFVNGNNWIATAFYYQDAMPHWLGWIAVVLLALYLALFPAFATGAARALMRWVPTPYALAATWAVGEWLRATVFTGFAWNPLAVIWVAPGMLTHSARAIGSYGLSGLTVLLAGLLCQLAALLRAGRSARWRPMAVELAIGLGIVALAALAPLFGPAPVGPPGPALRVIQPNINQAEKWRADLQVTNFRRLATLTGAPTGTPRLILWPEVAVPDYLEEEPRARARIARLIGPRDLLLTGGIAWRYDVEGRPVAAFNSLFAMNPRGRLLGRYDKSHLVPYGEYLPMRPILSRIGLSRLAPGDMDFDAGPGPRGIALPGLGTVGVQICYEIIFSGQVVDRAHRPRFLFNPSNDAWFGASGPPQHLAQARLRAVEEAMPIVRATPTGISAVIDSDGRLIASLPWHKAGAIDALLPPPAPPTLFARYGNVLALGFAALLALAGFATRPRGR
jgi:apolipoprotein N-acyltransferase